MSNTSKESFLTFCRKHAATSDVGVAADAGIDVEERYVGPIENVSRIVRDKLEIINEWPIPFIQLALEDPDVAETLKEKLVDDEIPDSMLNRISKYVFNENNFNQLNDDGKSIIKILAVYIILQN